MFFTDCRYDTHHIMARIGDLLRDKPNITVKPVAKTLEDYLSFSITVHSCKVGAEEEDKKEPTTTTSVADMIEREMEENGGFACVFFNLVAFESFQLLCIAGYILCVIEVYYITQCRYIGLV